MHGMSTARCGVSKKQDTKQASGNLPREMKHEWQCLGGKNMKKKNLKITCSVQIIFITILTFFFCIFPSPKPASALSGADVAVYNDSMAPIPNTSGAWQSGVIAIKRMLTNLGFTYEEINYHHLNDPHLNFSALYKVILIPGGYAQWYNYWISRSGKEQIRNFVRNGGGYFGICAGAFFASDRIVWEGVTYDDDAGYNVYEELTGYDLDLFSGTGTGPMNAIADWNKEGYNMTTFDFTTENTVLKGYKKPPYTEDILYYGGPYFTADSGANIEILAKYRYNSKPGIIAFKYGSGRVVLSGPHPEIEEDSDRDGVTIPREDSMNDNGSDWLLTKYILRWLMKMDASKQPSAWLPLLLE